VAEKWRTELLANADAIERFTAEFPEADPEKLRDLVDKARNERAADRSPKKYRELFHVVNAIVQDHAGHQP
jgi:ribosome-associated protein